MSVTKRLLERKMYQEQIPFRQKFLGYPRHEVTNLIFPEKIDPRLIWQSDKKKKKK
jgi:hypothetical protein